MDNINILQAMQSLDFILEDIDDEEIKKWVSNELNGYKKNDEIKKNNERKYNMLIPN